ncbi:MAG TPA: hypothetical protein VHN37_12810 [Actinomycetota bacterium]|nr:hypothetical protein [Actinomycetota bacterium]
MSPKWYTQDKTDDVHVKVAADEERDTGTPTTSFVIAYRDGSGDHEHVVIDHDGNTVHDTTAS